MISETPRRLLKDLAAALGLPQIDLDENGLAGLRFDGHEIMLIWIEDEQSFLFCGALQLPVTLTEAGRLTLYQRLLEHNHLMAGASHAAIGIKPKSDILTLSAHWPAPPSAEVIAMGEALFTFVEDLRSLAQGLGDWHWSGEEAESQSLPGEVDPRQFV